VPARLREVVSRIPHTTRPSAFPALDAAIDRVFGRSTWLRPVLILVIILAIVLAAVGAAALQPWRPFPPRGLIAFSGVPGPTGTTEIGLVAADGTGERLLMQSQPYVYDHSPRWSRDGRTLLFARTQLDSTSYCSGVGSIVLYDVASEVQTVVASGLPAIDVVEWSPTGDRVAYLYPPPGCGAAALLGVVDLASGHVTTTPVTTDPVSGGSWRVEWSGGVARAVEKAHVNLGGRVVTTTVEVASHDGGSVVRFDWQTPDRNAKLEVLYGTSAGSVDLGAGGVPAWAPDDSALAFLEPGGPAGPTAVDMDRHPIAIVATGTWQRRLVADAFWPMDTPMSDLPPVSWTADGSAIFWIDARGGHVVDVVTGRTADLPTAVRACPDLQWQPVP
jgi:hypothetical protein